MKREPDACCQSAGAHCCRQEALASSVPWFEGSSDTTSSTRFRVSGQNRRAQRGSMPPWLYPRTSTLRPEILATVRSAFTTYSPAIWMSPIV